MMSLDDVQELIALGFLDGNYEIAGIAIYMVVLIVVFAMSRNITQTLILSLPVTFIFSLLGVLSSDFMILMIIVTVLGLAYTARNTWRRCYARFIWGCRLDL